MKWYDTWWIGSLLGILPLGRWIGYPLGIILQLMSTAWLIVCFIGLYKEDVRISKKLESLTQSGGTQA